jgi:2,4-diaminopentanoate dehydrogenase
MPDESMRHDEVTALLRSGKNVVTSTAYFFPWQWGRDYVEPLVAAARAGGVSLHGTGVHPSWFMERHALTLSALCNRVRRVEFGEIVDISHHSGQAIAGMGYGRPPHQLGTVTRKTILSRYYFECIASLAHALGVRLDEIVADISYPTTSRRIKLPTVDIQPGTVAAVDGRWTGLAGGSAFITLRELWYADASLAEGIELTSRDFYDVAVTGSPVSVRARVDLAVTSEADVLGQDSLQVGANLATAVQLVLTVPAVVAAPPGIVVPSVFAYPALDLRQVTDRFTRPPDPVPTRILLSGQGRKLAGPGGH